MTIVATAEMKQYFNTLSEEVQRSYEFAEAARKKGLDPEKNVAIPIAKNMAERVVGLISVAAPQVIGSKIPERIIELEKKYGLLDWRVGLNIAEEVAQEKFCKFSDRKEALEVGIRVGFAYLTLGIVSAPLEGFVGLKLKKRKDGKEYFALQYAGPIRAAGGTGQSISVIIADYVRTRMGYAPYDPDSNEINRYAIEVHDYHERVTNLQYHPSDEELKFLISHLPVEVDGDPTERFEVSNYKDLPRIETNMIRGGVALVLAEGLAQKAPKLWKKLAKWGPEFGLEWGWLDEFLKLKEKIHSAGQVKKKESNEQKTVKPNNTFIMDLVAGRPILTHPLGAGGFRLRYGRVRTGGMYAVGMHPATMIVLDKFIAIGSQLKVERPRKGATATVCDTIEGPIVRLLDGSVLQLKTEDEAKQSLSQVEEILFLGDILFNYGDFSESGHSLVPVGYCAEWWSAELEKAINNLFEQEGTKKAAELTGIEEKRLEDFLKQPLFIVPTWSEALQLSKTLQLPLHPDYTFYWKLVKGKDLLELKAWFLEGNVKIDKEDKEGITKIILPYYSKTEAHRKVKDVLDWLGVPHQIINKENLVLAKKEANIFAFCFDFKDQKGLESINLTSESVQGKDGLEIVNFLANATIRDKAGTFIGARMGRPEKAKMRHLTGSPQVMFPVGKEGDRLRSFQSALKAGKINSAFPVYYCNNCRREMIYPQCEECQKECVPRYNCRFCGDLEKEQCRHGLADRFKTSDIDIKYYLQKAKERVGENVLPELIKGVRGTSNKNHMVEHLAKGILRAKHNVYVNKDGTIRYDCTELPLTHFKPKEIKTSVERLKELGYLKDIYGEKLVNEEQILELKPQDLVLPGYDSLDESAPKVLSRVARFIDDLLVKFYDLKPFYNLHTEKDLVGHLVIGLAPHISAGLVGRIIGFSEIQGLLAHPMFHAGLRRDCDGDEAAIMLLTDALLNFSRQYLPEKRGAKTMDAPLVLTTILNPSEVDDQVLEMDTVWKYPLELYEAAAEMKFPGEVKVEQLRSRLGKVTQYEQIGFTHHVDDFNKGVRCSAYKTLPSMEEKLIGQMELAKRIRAVDMDDVAKLVIQKHFLKDIKGNLKKFSMQQFRCVKCNKKYRRPSLSGKCSCGSKLLFTITEGSVSKYLGHSLNLAEKYDFSPYLKQTLEILQLNVEMVFGREKEKQTGLATFMA